MRPQRLTSLAEIGQFYIRPERAPSLAEPTVHRPHHHLSGFVVFITTRRGAGFVSHAGFSELSLNDDQRGAWVFGTHAAIQRALDLALGLNRRACRIEILPALVAPRTIREAA